VDYGAGSVEAATLRADLAGVSDLVRFERGDAEQLRFADQSFEAIICECAFCTFPNKAAAAREFFRLLRPGGQVGLNDLTRSGPLPPELEGLLAWIACIADARPIEEYSFCLESAGLAVQRIELRNAALREMVREIRTKLLGAEVLVKLKKLTLPPGLDLEQAKIMAGHAAKAVHQGKLGYALLTGSKVEK
jgi:ubiquinone/menaquinone biosynthesis C-methylase UbiE